MFEKIVKANLSFLFLISFSSYAQPNDFELEFIPKLSPPHFSNKNYAQDNEVVYIIDEGTGHLKAKIAKIKGVDTTGGVDEEADKLIDYRIKLSTPSNSNLAVNLDQAIQQNSKCSEIQFSFGSSYAYISRLPNILDTAIFCSFNINADGRTIKKISFLLNYSYKKWCNLSTGTEASKTARLVSSTCDANTVKNLTVFEKTSGQIKDISALSGLVKLKKLNLRANLIENLPTGIFSKLKNLESLVLWENKITKFEENVFQYNTNLTYLDIDDNKVYLLPKGIFSTLVNLSTLDIRRMALRSIDSEIFRNNVKLYTLHLHLNSLTNLPANIFDNLTNINSIDVDEGAITNLNELRSRQNNRLRNIIK
ncbi:leucine-rich repeat domain-containing protein [Pigmentibacter ruber]|uniref:leucine-rich repeat domain-containing protein n=1 Tax=Pigmentibacter ruber TaxID=2683196 RepID=UPI00131B1034|nr:leucine-rich repeat domain-containing protein [Pigmentibacter ruber]